jgi:hypothetical protein
VKSSVQAFRLPDDGAGKLVRPPNRRSNFGGSLGGPIILPRYDGHNKTFFFFSFEQFRQIETKADFRNHADRQDATRRFQRSLTAVLNDRFGVRSWKMPFTIRTRRAPNGQIVRDPFLNNTILRNTRSVALNQSFIPTATKSSDQQRDHPPAGDQVHCDAQVDHNCSAGAVSITRSTVGPTQRI